MSTAPDTAQDALVRQMRDQIVDNDVAIVALINKRLQLVARLWEYKQANALPMVDSSREEWMQRFIQGTNSGPISADGLAGMYRDLLALTKRELAGPPPTRA